MASTASYYNPQYAPPSRTGTFSSTISDSSFRPATLERSFSGMTMGDVTPDSNIVNRRGGLENNLYQSCIVLRRRLAYVPGFERWLMEMDEEEQESDSTVDPVTLMWNTLRRGDPLIAIYNALQPPVPLTAGPTRANLSQANAGKATTFNFLQACIKELKFPAPECFLITDLYGSDTTGFVKVLKVVSRVLDVLSQRGLMIEADEQPAAGEIMGGKGRTAREHIVAEIVSTERDYVQHLEVLQQFKLQLQDVPALAGDVCHRIFMNLNQLLDFQRRFLIRIEQQNSLDPSLQNWGILFSEYQESFDAYETFIANSAQCNETVINEWDKIKAAPLQPAFQGLVEAPIVLTGFLLKPFQRLTKYPLLLDDLRKRGEYDEEKSEALRLGSEAMKRVLDKANHAVDRSKMTEEVQELIQLVDDWKGHRIENFGDLVCCGTFPVLKGEGSKETERELARGQRVILKMPFKMANNDQYKIYLFDRILLCCKELNPKKEKNRLAGSTKDKKGRTKLQLKGRIFIQNVTDMISTPKADHHLLQIWWKGDPGIETFVIKFKLLADKDKWCGQIKDLRAKLKADQAASSAGVSQIEFTSMSGLAGNIVNPYKEMDDDGEEDEPVRFSQADTLVGQYANGRNASNPSLRSRSTTGGSTRVPPPRFPLPQPHDPYNGQPLKVTTNIEEPGTPDERFASHFSPTGDSPNSMRSSSQAGVYPFPRQHTPSNSGWPPQDNSGNKHNTAPPMARAPYREDENGNVYGANGRSVQRPSLPAMTASAQQAAFAQSRSRSLSSPDVHNPNHPVRRLPNGQLSGGGDDVPVPSIPQHLAGLRAPVNRSQNNSPTDNTRIRGQTQSPSMMRSPPTFPNNYGYNTYPPNAPGTGQLFNGSQMTGAGRVLSPPLSASSVQPDAPVTVSQLKVKVHFDPEPSHVTIVVPVIIKHRSLIDRIDSKMERVASSSIARGTAKLRYKDTEGELVLIDNDEDVQMAIEDWLEGNDASLRTNHIPDFDLYWKDTNRGSARAS